MGIFSDIILTLAIVKGIRIECAASDIVRVLGNAWRKDGQNTINQFQMNPDEVSISNYCKSTR